MFRPLALLSAVLAVGISVTDAKLEDKFVKPFTVNPECGQLGVAPAGLAAELPDGYDYSCYEPSPINKRWSTEDGLDMNDFFGEDADMMGALIPYLQSMIMIVAPILAFGIISVIGCCCWSCGMLECCAGGNGKPRKGCGKCCANPPKWTEGFFEWILMAVTLFLGVVVVGLALKGLAVNKIQNDAIEKLGGAVGLLDSWMDSATARVDNVTGSFANVQAETDTLVTILENMNTNEIRNQSKEAAGSLKEAIDTAAGHVAMVDTNVATLKDSVGSMGSLGDSITPVNQYRNTGMLAIWVLLVSLMILELLIAFFKQWKPEMTARCGCKCLFGLITALYLFVLLILFIVLVIVAVITVLFGDICKSPDAQLSGIVNSLGGAAEATTLGPIVSAGSVNSTAGSANSTADSSGSALVLPEVGPSLMTYYLECDTSAAKNNSFNGLALDVFNKFGSAGGSVKQLKTTFANQQPIVEATYKIATDAVANAARLLELTENTPNYGAAVEAEKDAAEAEAEAKVIYDNFFVDQTNVDAAVDGISLRLEELTLSLAGTTYMPSSVPAQGMTDGMFSVVQCYQVNARYQAVIGMMCGQFFETIAMTLEYLLVAGVLMVIVEFCKRLMRPYNEAYDPNNKIAPAGEDRWNVAKGREASNAGNVV